MTTHDDAHSVSPSAPPGFERLNRGGPYMANLGELYCRRGDGGIVFAMRIEDKHTNMRGIAHGGMLASLADSALGLGLTLYCEGRQSFVTVNLSTDFIDAARPGDWVEAHVEVQKMGKRMAFANCFLQVGARRILRASGVFAVMNALRPDQLEAGY
ncbi:MAG: PaaI family thioesterase [Massilia sp.]|uniref:PaaI family thioesterase n=1 Tax=Massilia sp. TaxID=1882437 RepID=UPI0019B8FCAC|nr:PaaI family thioesterase [Oxalobacteraceae sp. CFBP 8755]